MVIESRFENNCEADAQNNYEGNDRVMEMNG